MVKSIGRFEILGEIGKGGMGTVFKAKDPRIKRVVAIKLLNEGFDNPKNRERFEQEAQAAGTLQDRHIVTVFELGDYKGNPYIVMEFLVGNPLDRLIRQRENMPLDSKLKLMAGLCSGLAAAHEAGIIHRDIKPANLMVCADNVLKILDFGVARVGARVGEPGLTMTGAVIGTANYMSPEQCRGETKLDARSDIFAVGAVFYELLTYQRAFPGQPWEVFPKIQNPNPTPVATLCADLDSEIPEMISKALQKNPGDRYQSVTEMGREISRIRNRLERVRALAEVAAAREMFEQGKVQEAISRLERFTPSIELVDSALADLRQKAEQKAREMQREAAIARALLAAREALERSDFESAIRAADEVRQLDRSNDAAQALREQARHALEEKLRQEEALCQREHERAARAIVEHARRQFDSGDRSEALHDLERFSPPHVLVEGMIATLRSELAEIERKEHEARERAQAEEQERQLEEQRRREAEAQRRLAEIEQSVELAEQALRVGQFLSALSHAKAALARQPDHAKASDLHRQAAAALELEHRAERAVAQAHADFTTGKHLAALQSLAAFTPSHPLVSRALDTLRHELQVVAFASAEAAMAEDRIDDARAALIEAEQSGTPSDRLDDLRTRIREMERELQRLAQLLDEGATALAQRDFTRAAERVQAALRVRPNSAAAKELGVRLAAAVEQRRDAEATRTVEQARRLFDAGRHEEALTQLRNAPAHPLTQSTFENLEAKFKGITRERDADANRTVERARQLFDAGRHEEALAQLRNAPAHPLTQSTFETLEAKYEDIQRERERQARDAEANRTVERARRLFDAGRHEEALAQLRNAPAHPLTQSTFENLEAKYKDITRERDAEANRIVEQARRLFDAGRHEEALTQLRNAPAHPLTQSTFETLEAKYEEIKQQARDAEAKRIVEQARQLFDAGHHEEALERLRNAPPHPLTQSTFEDLEAKYKEIKQQARDAAAKRIVDQARRLFDAGHHEEALAQLKNAPAHALTQSTFEDLEAKCKEIKQQARDAEAKRIVDQARWLFDAGRHEEALAQLRNAPAHPLTQSTFKDLEAKYKEIKQQARDAAAKRIVDQARRLFDAGHHEEALAQLRNAPAHPLTQSTFEDLEAKYKEIKQQARDAEAKRIVEQARWLFDAGHHEEALEQLRNAPAHTLTQSTLQTLTRERVRQERRRRRQARRAAAVAALRRTLGDRRLHLTGAVVAVALGWSTWQFWPTSTSPPPVVNTQPDPGGSPQPVAPASPDATPKKSPEPSDPPDARSEPPKEDRRDDVSPKPSPVDRRSDVTPPTPQPPAPELKPKPPPPSPAPNLDPERIAIRKFVDDYVAAYKQMDDKGLNQIDPTFPGIHGRALLKGLEVQVSDVNITVAPNAQSALVTFTQSFNYEWSRPNLPQSAKRTVKWSLHDDSGNWKVKEGTATELGGRAEIETEVNRKDIEDTLEKYRTAFNKQDIGLINQLYPDGKQTRATLFGSGCSKLDLTFKTVPKVELLSETAAQVETISVRTCTPETKGKPRVGEGSELFRFQKRGSSWIIERLATVFPRGGR